MRLWVAGLGASILLACGGEPDVNVTLQIDPPADTISCVGVAGFQITVSPAGTETHTERQVVPATILDSDDCALRTAISVTALDVDAPVSVTVEGYDGGGALRVYGQSLLGNLRESPAPLQLKPATPTLPPLLVIDRMRWLVGASVSEVQTMSISRQMGSVPLLTVTRDAAHEFFDPEPGAYGIRELEGTPDGTDIVLKFELSNKTINSARFPILYDGAKNYYRAQ